MPKFSTGLRNSMLNDTGFKTLMDGGELRIFAVTAPDVVPLTADDAEAGELLMTLTAGGAGGGLNFSVPEGAAISKAEAEVWMTSSVGADGKCAYFRFVQPADDGTASDALPRIQGTCGLVAADMVLTNINVTAGLPWTLNFFTVGFPTQ